MKIAVTGASGHAGTNLCPMLADRGYRARALIHNNSESLENQSIDFVIGNETNEPDLGRLCEGCSVVFHLADCISKRKIRGEWW